MSRTASKLADVSAMSVFKDETLTDEQRAALKELAANPGKVEIIEQPAPVADPDAGFLYVMDKSATPSSGARTHEQYLANGVLKSFTFEYGKPLRLPFAMAVRFLKSDGFYRSDENGDELPFDRAPKRPEELGAGERLVISENEVIARYSELTDQALKLRCAALPGSEDVVANGPRERVIKFIVDHNIKVRELNTVNERGADEFTPEPFLDDDRY